MTALRGARPTDPCLWREAGPRWCHLDRAATVARCAQERASNDLQIDQTTEDPLEQEAADLALAPSVQAVDTAAASEERKKLRRTVGGLDTAFPMLAAIS